MTIPGVFSDARRDWRAERAFIQWLVDTLEAQARAAHGSDDFHLWRDETGLRWGDDWPHKLHEQIGRTELFFVLLSPSWIKSSICRDELAVFLEREDSQRWSGRIFIAQIRDIPDNDPEIDDAMKALLALLDKRQVKRRRPLLDAPQATRETALRGAGDEIRDVLIKVTAARTLPQEDRQPYCRQRQHLCHGPPGSIQ